MNAEGRGINTWRTAGSGWYKPYPAYEDSGVEWLGEIPAHWEVKRLRFAADLNLSPTAEVRSLSQGAEVSFVPMEAVGEYGGLDLTRTKALSDLGAGYTYFANGDVILARITPCFENGKGALAAGLANGIGFGITELQVLRPGFELLVQFLGYLTYSRPFRGLGQVQMKGAAGPQRVPEDFTKEKAIANIREAIAAYVKRRGKKIICRCHRRVRDDRGGSVTKLLRIGDRDCIRALERAGFYRKRQTGSHVVMRRDEPFAQVVVPDHDELDRGTLWAPSSARPG